MKILTIVKFMKNNKNIEGYLIRKAHEPIIYYI